MNQPQPHKRQVFTRPFNMAATNPNLPSMSYMVAYLETYLVASHYLPFVIFTIHKNLLPNLIPLTT